MVILVAGIVAACGSGGENSVIQAPLPPINAASLPHLGLIAVLQAPKSTLGAVYDTIALVRAGDGTVLNRATFTPRQPPYSGDASSILPPAATVAAGSVWVLDGAGGVLRLGPNGPAERVASFSVPAQGAASLAVSRDGRSLMSSAYTARQQPQTQPGVTTPVQQPAPASIAVRTASIGASSPVVVRTVTDPNFQPPLAAGDPTETIGLVEGWDDHGPVEALHPPLGSQDYAQLGYQSPISNVDPASGKPTGLPIGGSGCIAVDELSTGVTLCAGLKTSSATSSPQVRNRTGSSLYVASVPSGSQPAASFSPRLSPDGAHVAMALDEQATPEAPTKPAPAAVVGYDGTTVRLPLGCEPVGWADVATVVCAPVPSSEGAPGAGGLGLVRIAAPQTVAPTGVGGVFAGSL